MSAFISFSKLYICLVIFPFVVIATIAQNTVGNLVYSMSPYQSSGLVHCTFN